jgi:NADPH:quinone reductase-like Zn-dependent oxidoreductase
MMKNMNAICLCDSAGLVAREVAIPHPAANQVLIRVHAAGVTPTELLWYPTTHVKTGEPRHDAIPGHEFSGVVAAVGDQVTDVQIGQEVYGMNDWFSDGATAEYCLTEPASVAPKPRLLSHAEAASVPIGALTAWQGLFGRARLQAGERILVHGGAGAVGIYAIQLARRVGAHVMTTASARNTGFLEQLGAEEVIDYKVARFEDVARDMDVVFDAVGGETLQRSWGVLKPSGRMVTVATAGEATQDERTKASFFIVEPNQQQLTEIAALLDSRALQPFVDAIVPLAEAPAAYLGKAVRAKGRGKMVVAVVEG